MARSTFLDKQIATSYGGEKYIEINSTGDGANATGADSIAIGYTSDILSDRGIAIGYASVIGAANSDKSIAVGDTARVDSLESIAIGPEAFCKTMTRKSVAIGKNATIDTNSRYSTAIGYYARVTAESSIVIGSPALSQSEKSIVMGSPATSRSEKSIAIGWQAGINTSSNNSIAIGYASVNSGNPSGIAIGYQAISNAAGAVQIGSGSNSASNTIQFQSNRIANTTGILAGASSGAPAGAGTTNEIRFDSGTGILYIYDGSSWLSTTLT